MEKVKKTKNALRSERESLQRYHRFLPTLELKKQQLQAETRLVDHSLQEAEREEREIMDGLRPWLRLWAEDVDLAGHLELREVITAAGNIAGVNVPVFQDVVIYQKPVDLFGSPPWIDDALEVLRRLVRLRVERTVLREQKRLLSEELRITSQRVNLFEKVKIPQGDEHIRVIRIALGDMQTAAVVRAKIAKGKQRAAVSGTSGVSEE